MSRHRLTDLDDIDSEAVEASEKSFFRSLIVGFGCMEWDMHGGLCNGGHGENVGGFLVVESDIFIFYLLTSVF